MKKLVVYIFPILLIMLGCTSFAMKESKSLIVNNWKRLLDRAVYRSNLVRSLSAPSALDGHYQLPVPGPLTKAAQLNINDLHKTIVGAPLNVLGKLLITNYKISIYLAERMSFPPPDWHEGPTFEVSDYIADSLDVLYDCVRDTGLSTCAIIWLIRLTACITHWTDFRHTIGLPCVNR